MSSGIIDTQQWQPGQIWTSKKEIVQKEQSVSVEITLRNTGDRPIQVGSHFHFFEVNKELAFAREQAWGMRLAIASGTARRFEPGMEYVVSLIAMEGEREVFGCNGLASGSLDNQKNKDRALKEAKEKGFKE